MPAATIDRRTLINVIAAPRPGTGPAGKVAPLTKHQAITKRDVLRGCGWRAAATRRADLVYGAGAWTDTAGRVHSRFCDTDSMICAVMISARCENACGKLPICRCSFGSYSSDSRPR